MKNILCFGDSNTWGYTPVTGQRYPLSVRWTGVLQQSLGDDYYVIEQGLNGRTTRLDEPGRADRNGIALLPVMLESHRPLALVVIMLGTNDLKAHYQQSAKDVAQSAGLLCKMVLENDYLEGQTQVLLVSPTWITKLPDDCQEVFARATDKSRMLASCFAKIAEQLQIHFFNATKVVKTTNSDGVHWEAQQHNDFGQALAIKIQSVLDGS
ncbi:MAG: SGNH/GDSL hydrolase family protein [Algicola sp.]|nr:SGNH/GDSL hydrolase family protein [Algicola sp.]